MSKAKKIKAAFNYSQETHLRSMERHLPYGITPNIGERNLLLEL